MAKIDYERKNWEGLLRNIDETLFMYKPYLGNPNDFVRLNSRVVVDALERMALPIKKNLGIPLEDKYKQNIQHKLEEINRVRF